MSNSTFTDQSIIGGFQGSIDNLGLPVPDITVVLIKSLSPRDAAIVYGMIGLILSAGPGLLWRFYLRSNTYLGTVGYKFFAYT